MIVEIILYMYQISPLSRLVCNCVWDTKNFVVNPRLSECSDKDIKPTVSHPVSLPIMHAFDMVKHMTVPRTYVVSNKTPSIPLPDMDKAGKEMHPLIREKGVKTSELPTMLDNIKLHKVDPLKEIKIGQSSKPDSWLTYGLIVWNIVLSIMVAFLCCRL